MTSVAARAGGIGHFLAPPKAIGLSGRLILLMMAFVIVAEVLLYIPFASSFRKSWLSDRVMGARMIALALSSTPTEAVSPDLEARLLSGIKGAQAIGVRGNGTRWLLAVRGESPPETSLVIDLRDVPWFGPVRGLLRTLFTPPAPAARIIGDGMAGVAGLDWVELVVDESPLRDAVLAFTGRFVVVSLLILAIVGAALFFALHMLVVRPVQRLTDNIARFAAAPEDLGRVIAPSGRRDEIGRAEEALAHMETALVGELRHKRRLADLGLAVSKINHELRNMLTTAQLLGDRLDEIDDPAARRIAPRLVRTLARAVEFCGATLAYGRAAEPPPQRRQVPLRPLVEEQAELTALAALPQVTVAIDIPPGLLVDADPEQLSRVLLNLVQNAVEAFGRAPAADRRIEIGSRRTGRSVEIRVRDNGPGVPERVRDRLFSAFQASQRTGGTGLGLPVADELVRLHGGSLILERTETGASFLLTIPDRG